MSSARADDLYDVLGVEPDAAPDELDHAFRVLARRHHPDTRIQHEPPGATPDAEPDSARFQEILSAYAVLRDPVARAAYDRRNGQLVARPNRPSSRVTSAPPRPVTPLFGVDPPLRAGPVRWTPVTYRRPAGQ